MDKEDNQADSASIDHESRQGYHYQSRLVSEDTRLRRSEAMKAFNRKNGKLTLLANARVRSIRKSK